MKRPVQFFSKEHLQRCKTMKPVHILRFLEDFRLLHASIPEKKRLISMRISETLLRMAKAKSAALGVPYQTQIQRLIEAWVKT